MYRKNTVYVGFWYYSRFQAFTGVFERIPRDKGGTPIGGAGTAVIGTRKRKQLGGYI